MRRGEGIIIPFSILWSELEVKSGWVLTENLLCSVGLHKDEELLALKERMKGAGMRTMDLTKNDLAKDHLRHLVPPFSSVLTFNA